MMSELFNKMIWKCKFWQVVQMIFLWNWSGIDANVLKSEIIQVMAWCLTITWTNIDQAPCCHMASVGCIQSCLLAVTNIASKRQSTHKIDWGSFHDISDKLIIVLQSADLDDANNCFEVSHDRCSETMTAYTNEVPRLCLLGKITCVTYDEYKNQVQHTDCRTPQLYIVTCRNIRIHVSYTAKHTNC